MQHLLLRIAFVLFIVATMLAPVPGYSGTPIDGKAPPAQFVAKLYSEALGRAPDEGAWKNNTLYYLSNGCNPTTLQSLITNVFAPAPSEYADKGYTAGQQVVTLYRAVLSREPDQVGFDYWKAQIAAGVTAQQVAQALADPGPPTQPTEFGLLISEICRNADETKVVWDYRRNWLAVEAIPAGPGGVYTQSYVQSCINSSTAAQPCQLAQGSIVRLTAPLVIGPGNVLTTAGNPGVLSYAKQARLVRDAPVGDFTSLINVADGGTIRNVWISGQRQKHGYSTSSAATRPNITATGTDVQSGKTTVIDNVRSDTAIQATNIETFGSAAVVNITNNLITAYTASHYLSTETAGKPWLDGISHHAKKGLIQGNAIIDPTDVGIVLFGNDTGVQSTMVSGNTILHAGQHAYGSIGFDTTDPTCHLCLFTGATFDSNLVFGGTMTHSDIMLFVGTAPWAPSGEADCSATSSTSRQYCGSGAVMTNNRTIQNDPDQYPTVQVAILVDQMQNATTNANALWVRPSSLAGDGGCYRPGYAIANHTNNGPNTHASGANMQGPAYVDSVHHCIGHGLRSGYSVTDSIVGQ